MAVGLPEGPSYPGTPVTQTIFSPCSPLNHCRRVARSLFKIGLSSLYSCLSLAGLLILLLLLMSGNVHSNPCPVFPCSVCAGNVTWRGRSVQCCTCFNCVHLKCSLLFFSRFRTLGSSHSWSCPPYCALAFFGDPTLTSTVVSDSSRWYISTDQSGPVLLKCSTRTPPSPSNLLSFYRPLCVFSALPQPFYACGCFSLPSASSSPS